MKRAALIFILSVSCLVLKAQNRIVDDFMPLCDTLAVLIQEHSGVKGEVELKGIMKRGSSLDFYFSETLGDFPWYKGDVKWFRNRLKSLFPDEYRNLRLGEIYSRRVSLDCLEMPGLTCNGRPAGSRYRVKPASRNLMIVRRPGAQTFSKGLSGRHIALWQSHGRYYDHNTGIWTWQRPCLFGTCEDMFTQSFVLQYLVPMLENAGAYVMLPRERDIQTQEIIADNDSTAGKRGKANYEETGRWATSEEGFADLKPVYEDCENPFKTGTSRTTRCTTASVPSSTARWTPEIPDRGKYAVYVSYRSFPNSSTAAHYTVSHMGGTTEFAVNQKMGAGTWIYLGTFEFEAGTNGCVTLDNLVPKGHQVAEGSCISADAVKFGGGMGNISRNGLVSGMPRSAEGARYWLQWAGADTTVYYQNGGKNDYKDDFMSRGDWAEWISRGSRIKPEATGGLGIPVDLTMGFHSDAGVTPNDSLVGTLAIYTYRSDGKTELPSGEVRLTSRMYADIVQNQVVRDIRAIYDTLWTRRSIWDRAYRESRTPSSPAIILELLSHQNFADMKYGLDPSFRFDVSRAVYKGMLKYLSNRYGCEYAVQPLPVSSAGATFGKDGKAIISWKPEKDPLEPTADPDGYILYTRISDGCFDQGTIIKAKDDEDGYCRCEVELIPGEVMCFKIAAFNAGGEGFASETISIGTPLECAPDSQTVLIVNNFDRVSGPAVRDGEGNVGFDHRLDGGVPYMLDMTFTGEMHNFRRQDEWISNDNPGFGASYTDMAGTVIAGNTFDYISVHGKAILKAGYPFYSCSNERFACDSTFAEPAGIMDMICGKQITTMSGNRQKFEIFPGPIQEAVTRFSTKGGNILVSGSYIASDIWDNRVSPVMTDTTATNRSKDFACNILGYRHATGRASRRGLTVPAPGQDIFGVGAMQINMEKNPKIYCVESPDGIAPASANGKTIYRYADSGISAGVAYQGNGYRCVSLGFPIETIDSQQAAEALIDDILKYFTDESDL